MYSWCLSQVSSFCKRGLESVSCTSFYSGQYILTYPCHYRMSMCTSSFIIDLREIFLYQSIDFALFSFLAHYNKKCFNINWFHLLSPTILSLWYSRFEVTWPLRDESNSKTRVRFVYMENLKMLNESSPQIFDRVKSVALWSAKKERKRDHKGLRFRS
jgi:hypothetical protein